MSTEKKLGQDFGDEYYRELAIQLVKNSSDAFSRVARNLDEYVSSMEELANGNKIGATPAEIESGLGRLLKSAIHVASQGVGTNVRIDQMADCIATLAVRSALAKAQQAEPDCDDWRSARKLPKAK